MNIYWGKCQFCLHLFWNSIFKKRCGWILFIEIFSDISESEYSWCFYDKHSCDMNIQEPLNWIYFVSDQATFRWQLWVTHFSPFFSFLLNMFLMYREVILCEVFFQKCKRGKNGKTLLHVVPQRVYFYLLFKCVTFAVETVSWRVNSDIITSSACYLLAFYLCGAYFNS